MRGRGENSRYKPRVVDGCRGLPRWSSCVAGSLASPAILVAATPAAEAENLIRDGVALRRQKHDEQALPLFQKAYDLIRNPRTAGQLGLCELGVGYSIDAEQHLKEALASSEHPWVAKNKASLDEALKRARQNIGEVAVTGAPVGAEVYVNGHSVGRLPLRDPIRLVRGVADIELRAPGYLTCAPVAQRDRSDPGGRPQAGARARGAGCARDQAPGAGRAGADFRITRGALWR